MVRAYFTSYLQRRLVPVNLPIRSQQFGGVGHQAFILLYRLGAPVAQLQYSIRQSLRCQFSQVIVQALCCFRALQGNFPAANDITGIELFHNVHDGHARLIITGLNRRLYTSGSSVTGQERGMRIDTRYARHINDFLRKYLPIRHDHHNIRLQGAQLLYSLGISHALRLVNRYPGLLGAYFNTRGSKLLVAPYRPIRLGYEPYQFAGRQQ